MCGDAVFRYAVHLFRSYLHLERLPELRHNRGVKRLIVVRLWHGDIIFNSVRKRFPHRVNLTEQCITVFYVVHYYPDCEKVVYLVYIDIEVTHFFENGIKMFCPAAHLAVYFEFGKFIFNFRAYLGQKFLSLTVVFFHIFCDIVIFFGIEITHCKVFELAFEKRYTEPACKRSIYLERFSRFVLLFLFRLKFERTHIVQTVGKLYNYDPEVVCHGDEHFPETFRLSVLTV